MKITCTNEDIASGIRHDPRACPIALAIRRTLGRKVSVTQMIATEFFLGGGLAGLFCLVAFIVVSIQERRKTRRIIEHYRNSQLNSWRQHRANTRPGNAQVPDRNTFNETHR